jgi:ABC-type dipeptide/oligopeptide/nickel transport system permease subunit
MKIVGSNGKKCDNSRILSVDSSIHVHTYTQELMEKLSTIQQIAVMAVPMIFAIVVHEVAHGWVANRLGDPTAPSWGQILDSAQSSGAPGLGAWWYFVPPAACVVLVVLSFTLVGNALDDILNPKSATRQ